MLLTFRLCECRNKKTEQKYLRFWKESISTLSYLVVGYFNMCKIEIIRLNGS